jgi:hypothetical protein
MNRTAGNEATRRYKLHEVEALVSDGNVMRQTRKDDQIQLSTVCLISCVANARKTYGFLCGILRTTAIRAFEAALMGWAASTLLIRMT